ncbi:MAG: gamma-glutamyltransferase [Devosia sp.]|nr:gamma-glutamyltransferase [Devosia sp.]
MVTSPDRLASQAGLDILRQGGNAIEAAVAIGAALAVTYPHFCGLGGDAVWLVADRTGRQTTFLGIGQAARNAVVDGPIPVRGSRSALTSAAVVDSWRHALDYSVTNWGGRQPLSTLLEPAIGYAENGFPLTGSQAFWLEFRGAETAAWPGFRTIFAPGDGLTARGSIFRQPQLATTLRAIARHGPREFYEGELAARLASGLAAAGSPLTAADLAATRTREATPLGLDYRGLTLLAPPPPTQGVSTLAIMGVLDRLDRSGVAEGSADFFHYAVEAVKQAFLDRGGIADPDFAAQATDRWLDPARLSGKAGVIERHHALPWPQPFRTGDTVFFAATDDAGRGVSVLQSLYFDWGSGVVAGDTGVLWQNRGAAFSADPAHPNAYAPGKRPFYTLNPGLALKDGVPHLLYGTQGADGQPQTLSIVLSRLIDYGLSPEDALRRPRFLLGRTFSDSRDSLKLEEDAGSIVLADLAARGHELSPISALSPLAGQAGVIRIAADGTLSGAHDPRSDGCALAL